MRRRDVGPRCLSSVSNVAVTACRWGRSLITPSSRRGRVDGVTWTPDTHTRDPQRSRNHHAGGDVHRNWHAAQHSIKSHCGHFASCRRGNAHVELLEKVSGKEISMEGAPVKTSSGPFAASVFSFDRSRRRSMASMAWRRRRRGHESLATPQAVPEGRRSARASSPRRDG